MPNASLILAFKIGVLATWFIAAAGFLVPDTEVFGRLGRLLFALLTVVHVIECAAFYKTLRRTGRPLALELLQTLFFGIIHYVEAKALADAHSGTSPEA